jgi:hypothetical protein
MRVSEVVCFEPDFLHVEVPVGDVGESSLHDFECRVVSGTPPRFQCIMNIWTQIGSLLRTGLIGC